MDRKKLKSLIDSKKERNQHLAVQLQYLELIEQELSKTRLKRFFSTTYLIAKRFTLIAASLIFIGLGVTIYFKPDLVTENTQLNQYLIDQVQENYQEAAGITLEQSLINLTINESNLSPSSISGSIEYGINKSIEKSVSDMIIRSALISLIIGILLLYISRLTKKIRLRNRQLSLAEGKIEKVLGEFKSIVNSEENELKDLEDIYHHNIVGEASHTTTS